LVVVVGIRHTPVDRRIRRVDILLEEGNIRLDLVGVLEEVGMTVEGTEDRRRNLYST
jgi:hypothetical protein